MVRFLSALILALVVAVTSQGMALARGQSMAVAETVICVAGGLAAVPVDAQGRPTGPPHVCPDATLLTTGAPCMAVPTRWTGAGMRPVDPGVTAIADVPRRAVGPMSARGPPTFA